MGSLTVYIDGFRMHEQLEGPEMQFLIGYLGEAN